MGTHRPGFAALMLAAVLAAPTVQAQQTGKDGAHLATGYMIYREVGRQIRESRDPRPALLVTTQHRIKLGPVKDGTAFTLTDLDTGIGPISLELIDVGGEVATGQANDLAWGWFLFVAATGETLRNDGNYELTIHYERLSTWIDSVAIDGAGKPVPNPTTVTQPVTLPPRQLGDGERIDNYGNVKTDGGASRTVAPSEREGFKGFLDDLKFELTPLTVEGSNELGLAYELGYELDRPSFGETRPGNFTMDFAFEGRDSTSSDDGALSEFSRGEFSARGMWLLGKERYYPIGARLAVGFEDGDDGSSSGGTATGQVVATLPYVGEVLQVWQETLGFERAFAPPYVSLAYIASGAEVGVDEQDRLELEAGWIAPVAETWDLNLRWRHMDFSESSVDDEELLEIDLTYYPGGDLSQGLRLSFEEGYRAAVGDIGSVLLLGYTVNL